MSTSRVRLHVEDFAGSGRRVILMHGWPLPADPGKVQLPVLRDAGHRVVAGDRRGFGRSEKPADGDECDTLVADLAGIIDPLESRHVTRVGVSMGAGEVARCIANHGDAHRHSRCSPRRCHRICSSAPTIRRGR